MKIKFIESTRYLKDGSLLKTKKLLYPSLTFPFLAAITPAGIKIVVQHEIFEDINFNDPIDLVGISTITNNVYRAYEIADQYRKRNISVVMGGFHITAEPDEALHHCDAVFIGEADETWPQFIEDFKKGHIKKRYVQNGRLPLLNNVAIPKLSVMNPDHYYNYTKKRWPTRFIPPVIPIQTARGCPNSCDFCDVVRFNKGNYRSRPVSDVVFEIKTQKAKVVCFVDDNIFASPSRAKELMKALIPLKIIWASQGTLNAAEDPELLDLAKKSGCKALLIGLETISQSNLQALDKSHLNKLENYEKNLRAFRKAGIDINASMIFGCDGDDMEVFNNTYDFLVRNKVPYAGLQPLRPTPGTPYYNRLKLQGRLKEEKWWLNKDRVADVFDLKFTGTKIDKCFAKKFFEFYKKFYSVSSIFQRLLLPPQKRFLVKIITHYFLRKKISPQRFISEG